MMIKTDLVQTLSGHMGCVWDVAWSPDGNSLASCGNDKVIKIWNKVSENPLSYSLKTILSDGHTRTIRSVCWSPCGNRLASSSFDATVGIWSKKDGEFDLDVNLEGHENEVKCTAWSTCGQLLATCGRDKLVCIYDVSSEDCDYEIAAILQSHVQDVKKVAWHPTAELLASCSYDGTIKLFKPALGEDDWTCVTTFPSQDDTIWSIAFDSTGKRLASCNDDGTVKIWQEYPSGNDLNISVSENEPAWKCVCTLSGCHNKPVYDIAWCHLTSLIATASGDNSITIFKEEQTTDTHLPSFIVAKKISAAHDEDVNSVSWNPKLPGILASASDNGEIKIWNFSDYEE